ncbi:hypothetical protein [Oxynema sp. CENA135]|uniref:hypothetical protein n=1 Tax=Oxynema sp. CENA135 TaxID=984206 RepID=UPI001F30FF52|nr:hypothetical protein [Oxynema sp. CENA135]
MVPLRERIESPPKASDRAIADNLGKHPIEGSRGDRPFGNRADFFPGRAIGVPRLPPPSIRRESRNFPLEFQ